MLQPIESVIIRAKQNFDVAEGLNPVQIEVEDDRIINTFKKYKNVVYKVTPLGYLFPASLKDDTEQIFITGKELSWVKKSILNGKVYDLIAIIDLDRISNWIEIKGQSIWISVALKDQKEVNNNSHLCFSFVTRSINDLTSFSIYFQDDKNKEIEFNSGENKISILNFQIDVYLRWAKEADKTKPVSKSKKNKLISIRRRGKKFKLV